MSDSRASPNLPPDGQSEQVSVDEPRDGGTGQIRRESPDGSENPVIEPIPGDVNQHTDDVSNAEVIEQNAQEQHENIPASTSNGSGSQPEPDKDAGDVENKSQTEDAGEQQNIKEEEGADAIDNNNNIREIETEAEVTAPTSEGGKADTVEEKDAEEDDKDAKPQDEEPAENINDEDVKDKPVGDNPEEAQFEAPISDIETATKTKENLAVPNAAQSQGLRKHTTTPADDSGLTQPILPAIPRGQAKVQQLASSISNARNQSGQQPVLQPVRNRVPPKLMRLATVTVSPAKTRPLTKGPSLYYEEPKRPQKVITWDQANNARPPLRIDMEGPGPCTYSPLIKPLNETNAPSYSFGSRCYPEKPGMGSRTSWAKSWFQSNHPYHYKADYIREGLWPSPNHYPKPNTLGLRQRTMYAAPSYTFGHRQEFSIIKAGSQKEPAPNDYEKQIADKHMFRRAPSYSHQFRREGTVLWGHPERTPGPAAYVPIKSARVQKPAYTIQGIRREKSHILGPYSTI